MSVLTSEAGSTAVLALVLAFMLDSLLGEPPLKAHPVAWFGQLIVLFDREWRWPLLSGVLIAGCLPLMAAVLTGLIVTTAFTVHPIAGAITAGVVLFVVTSRRMLLDTASEVVVLTETDLATARGRLRALAGREASSLSSGEVRSAAVESAAENLSDGLVAPLFAFALLVPVSLSLGTAGAAWVKAVNTLDSMLGYEHKRVGTASARLDDAVMWFPARVSALLIALAAGSLTALSVQTAWLDSVPSPNAGWPMGTLAVATDCQLTKPGVYTLNPEKSLPTVATAERGVHLISLASVLAFVFVCAALVLLFVLLQGVGQWI
ncbi:adenosylcobinamide-phosphate synthase CbiB [Halocatena marina]|uniref:adenosylcobinamide-phosphate synthase CbiB n=1 Tax=Halocatena marina TaxID=2934937 RepID=UPI00200C44C7|nr:adenosylcobinamide-phosphate synthase CbiB [Halocatena marina]